MLRRDDALLIPPLFLLSPSQFVSKCTRRIIMSGTHPRATSGGDTEALATEGGRRKKCTRSRVRDRMVECGGWQTDEGDEEISTQKRPRAAGI